MDAVAKLSSKGQVTIPSSVRKVLDLHEGDQVVFHVEGDCVVLRATPDLIALAGSVPVPADRRGADWDEVRRATWEARSAALSEGSDDPDGW